jgi:hypothetical protein
MVSLPIFVLRVGITYMVSLFARLFARIGRPLRGYIRSPPSSLDACALLSRTLLKRRNALPGERGGERALKGCY